MKQFVENAANSIMLDDFGYGNSFLEYAGITARFDNTPLLDPLFNYKNEYLPADIWILIRTLPQAASR